MAATQLMWRLRGVVPHAPWLVALVQHVGSVLVCGGSQATQM